MKEWDSQLHNPLITKVYYTVIYLLIIKCCNHSSLSNSTWTLWSIVYSILHFGVYDHLQEKDPPSCQETRFMQHSWYCRQMKILNASILFTIGALSNSNPKLSQFRDLSKETWRKQRSSRTFFLYNSPYRFPQLERFISMHASRTCHALNTTASANSAFLKYSFAK